MSSEWSVVGCEILSITTCNLLLHKHELDSEWTAEQQKGQLFLPGENIHAHLHHPFLPDHDFVIIKNKVTGEVIAVDPSLHDYTGIHYLNLIDK